MFRKSKQFRRFQDVVQQIQEAILDNRLSKGDVLPSERELKEIFNVSRGTLREALRVLEDRGLIEIKIGNHGGAFVRKLTPQRASENLAILIRSQVVTLQDLAEFRQTIEGEIGALAAQRVTQEEIAALRRLAMEGENFIEYDENQQNEFLSIDQQFHIELGKITKNPVYRMVMSTIHGNILRYYKQYLLMTREDIKENVRFFHEMIECLEQQQVNEARIIAQGHVMKFSRKKIRQTTHTNIAA